MSSVSFFDRKFLLCGILLVFLSGANSVVLAQDEFLFTDDFEVSSRAPITSSVVELRDSAGTVKATRSTNGSGLFAAFSTGQIDPGDSLVAFGGFWRGKPFAGEFRKLMASGGEVQTITPITTLVSTLAAADFITGSTASQRRADAVSRMSALGMIQADWDQVLPSRVNVPLQDAVEDAAGIQNWSNELVSQIEAGSIDPEHMAVFPFVNASVVEFLPLASGSQWLTGESASGQLEFQQSRESTAGWSWSLVSAPAWASLDPGGTLTWNVPDAATPSTGTIEVEVQDLETGLVRAHSFDYGIQDGTVVASAVFDSAGGQLWTPDNIAGIEVPADALSAPAEFQLVEYIESDGGVSTRFRTVPADLGTLLPIRFLFDPTSRRAAGSQRGGQFNCEVLSPGWNQKFCLDGLFLKVRVRDGLFDWDDAIKWNRLPERPTQFEVPDNNLFYRYETRRDITTVVQALCDDCSGKTPVLFVHGFTRSGIGGGPGTWGDLPALLHEFSDQQEFAVYEFRYRSNARFQEIARDLGEAIEFIYAETGNRKVNLIAHSFGGLASRSYLQGLAPNSQVPSAFTGCNVSRHPFVKGLLTIGTPHSGIATDPGNAHGTLLPAGRDGVAGSFIGVCKQVSCWQAGAEGRVFSGSADFRSAFSFLYGVQATPGEIVANLDDFISNPLTVPTSVNLSMRDKGSGDFAAERYDSGDGLISYLGQRFSPRLACPSGSCVESEVANAPFTEIAGSSIGHCVIERVLGDFESEAPLPEDFVPASIFAERAYRHSSTVPSSERVQPLVIKRFDLPNLDDSFVGLWAAKHDTFNQVLDWIMPGAVDRVLNLVITGQGAVEVFSGGSPITCTGSCTVPLDGSTAVLTLQPDVGAQVSALSSNCAELSPTQCEIQTPGPWTDASVEFSGGNQTQLTVTINGSGSVDVDPLGVQCSDRVCGYTLPENTALTLTPVTDAFVNWSGFCNVIGNECLLDSGEAGTQRFVTANFLPAPSVPSGPTGHLNDTGIDWCAGASSNNLSCPVAAYEGQDGEQGRDLLAREGLLAKVGSGKAGFDFTKIDSNGDVLSVDAANWFCVRDNQTGLIWEAKRDDGGLRDKDNTYTWYQPDPSTNGGAPGSEDGGECTDSRCDTSGFVQAVNSVGLCGASDWRVPSRQELYSLIYRGESCRYTSDCANDARMDPDYFKQIGLLPPPNGRPYYWTHTPRVGSSEAVGIDFSEGFMLISLKTEAYFVRLVRDAR